jgi:hypothetical protein
MNSPFAKLYTALITAIQATMPAIRYVSQDYGQLEFYDNTPPVSWPCVLLDVGDATFSDASHNMQLVNATVTLRLAHASYSDISSLPPAQVRELGLKHYELEHELCNILHNWQPPHDELGALTRIATATEKRDDNIRVRTITFSTSMQYDSTSTAVSTPTPLVINNQTL